MHRFLVVIEKAENNYSAYTSSLHPLVLPRLWARSSQSCTGSSMDMHVRGLLEDRLPVPKPQSSAEYIAINA